MNNLAENPLYQFSELRKYSLHTVGDLASLVSYIHHSGPCSANIVRMSKRGFVLDSCGRATKTGMVLTKPYVNVNTNVVRPKSLADITIRQAQVITIIATTPNPTYANLAGKLEVIGLERSALVSLAKSGYLHFVNKQHVLTEHGKVALTYLRDLFNVTNYSY